MKRIFVLMVMAAAVVGTRFAVPGDPVPTPTCAAEPPALPKIVQIDPKPARYAGPPCMAAEGETCTTPPDWFEEPGYKLTDQGAEITYEDQGTLYTVQCPNQTSYRFEEDQWVQHAYPTCWKRERVRISECHV